MSERDELADILMSDALNETAYVGRDYALAEADAILAAGYRKPRTITTDEELDALAPLTVIRSLDGIILERNFGWWQETGTRDLTSSDDIPLPAAVLHEGTRP